MMRTGGCTCCGAGRWRRRFRSRLSSLPMEETAATSTEPPAAAAPRPRRLRRWLVFVLILIVALLIAGEVIARFYFGLGNPPLMMADSQIEYLYKPDQTVHRFGH